MDELAGIAVTEVKSECALRNKHGGFGLPLMPRYFFNVDKIPPTQDTVGEELPDDEAAWQEATIVAGEIFKDFDGRLRPGQDWSLEVADEHRTPIFLIQISTKKMKRGRLS